MVAGTVAAVVEDRVSIVAAVAVVATATAVEAPGLHFLAKFTYAGTYAHMCTCIILLCT